MKDGIKQAKRLLEIAKNRVVEYNLNLKETTDAWELELFEEHKLMDKARFDYMKADLEVNKMEKDVAKY